MASLDQRFLCDADMTVGVARPCTVSRPFVPGLADYYVLSATEAGGALSSAELQELSALAHRLGRQLALRRHGDPECYSIIYNARRTRRKPWPHFHIILAATTLDKRRAFLLLQCKHVLRWLHVRFVRASGGPT